MADSYDFCGRYECKTDGHNKFWEVHENTNSEGEEFVISFGAIGKKPKFIYYSIGEIHDKIREKLRKGYVKSRARNNASNEPAPRKPKAAVQENSRLDTIE